MRETISPLIGWPFLATTAALVLAVNILIGLLRGNKKVNASPEQSAKLPKGSLGWPLIGESFQFTSSLNSSSPNRYIDERRKKYGKVFKTHLFGRKTIVTFDPSVSKGVLMAAMDAFEPWYPGPLAELLKKGALIHMTGSEHRKLHGTIGSFLKSSEHKTLAADRLGTCILSRMKDWEDGSVVLFQKEARKIFFQILLRSYTSLNMESRELQYFMQQYKQFIDGFLALPIKIPGFTFYKALQAKKRMMKFMENVVKERRKIMDKESNKTDVIGILLKSHTDGQIANIILDSIVPGDESVPSLATFAVKFLSESPDALKQLEEENMKLKLEKAKLGETLEWSNFMSLPFTQSVISETLRLANIAGGVLRKALKDMDFEGYLIPQGWCVMPYFRGMHLDKDIYQDPCKFNPWRWQDKETGGNATFTPFGGGLRLCPGMEFARLEVSILLHYLVTQFKWVAEEDTVVNFPFVNMKRGMPIRVTRKAEIDQNIY